MSPPLLNKNTKTHNMARFVDMSKHLDDNNMDENEIVAEVVMTVHLQE